MCELKWRNNRLGPASTSGGRMLVGVPGFGTVGPGGGVDADHETVFLTIGEGPFSA